MKPCRLRLRYPTGWPTPRIGGWLQTERGRTAYEVIGLRRVGTKLPGLGTRVLEFTCVRHPRADLPEGARVWTFAWDRRLPSASRAR